MIKKLFSVRKTLTYLLVLSIVWAAYSIHYKVKYWGFELFPSQVTEVWTVEAHIAFEALGGTSKVILTVPSSDQNLKILDESVVAPGYKVKHLENGNRKVELSVKDRYGLQNIYYQIMLYDNEDTKGKTKAPAPKAPKKPNFEEQRKAFAEEIIAMGRLEIGDPIQQLIKVFDHQPMDPVVIDFLQGRKSQKDKADAISSLLAYQGIPSRVIRGIVLAKDKKSFSPDLMLEAYSGENWRTYHTKTAETGIPKDFLVFQRGGDALLDIEGGESSSIKFSVLKSVTSSMKMASYRAQLNKKDKTFEYSLYSLPLTEQNTVKWLLIFPLAILGVVFMRNVIGWKTMGTFTPMLIAMSLVKTGLLSGVLCFGAIIGIGVVVRALLSRFNLLLVPRISAVVIFVILLMQFLTTFGYKLEVESALNSAFFPIIIMAWIIERASITWEEDGAMNAIHEVVFTLIVAICTYFLINSEYIRYIMFAFNELNLVILFIVMLLGTYTGYRVTELLRFAPLVKKG